MSIPPGKVIGILGGGQLGRMVALSARAMGYRIHVMDPDSSCPAAAIADRMIAARFDDAVAAGELARHADVVTVEIERISRDALAEAAKSAPTRPSASVLALAQDRRVEKTWLNVHGFDTVPWRAVTTAEELRQAVIELGASVVKTAREGYDGKGQKRIASADQADEVFKALGGVPCVVEQWTTLERELSVIVARSPSGEVKTFPPAHNHHVDGILDWSVMPGDHPASLTALAEDWACRIAAAMALEGMIAIEFFVLADGSIRVNEMAPRPHNSGHAATEACLTSQFEQLVRACCDLPLGSTEVVRPVAIANLLGDLWVNGTPAFEKALALDGVRLHLYGKESARPGRKMGHLSASGLTPKEAVEKVLEARRRLGG